MDVDLSVATDLEFLAWSRFLDLFLLAEPGFLHLDEGSLGRSERCINGV